MKKLLEIISSKGYVLFCVYLSAFFMVADFFAKRYGWTVMWAVLFVLNLRSYLEKRKQEPSTKPNVSPCPPHTWDVQDGFIHCTKCGEDLREKK